MSDQFRKWVPLDIAEFDDLNEELSDRELAAYVRLVVSAWKRGGKLDDNPSFLRSVSKAPPAIHGRALKCFDLIGGQWISQKLLSHRFKALDISEKRRGAALKRHHGESKVIPFSRD